MKPEKIDRQRKKVLGKQIPTPNSIICGTENPSSLHCVFYELEGGEAATTFVADSFHEGHGSMMHGGFIAAVIDEVMGRSINNMEGHPMKPFVTAEMTTTFRRPIVVGKQMYAFGRVIKAEGRRCYATSEIIDEEGMVMAKGSGVYVVVDQAGDDGGETYQGIPVLPLEDGEPKML
ncbi:MAG: PaaI family thioesterase [Firmicutes bacterium]|nr:PaaI family thioesterase [Bacillota bacterium]